MPGGTTGVNECGDSDSGRVTAGYLRFIESLLKVIWYLPIYLPYGELCVAIGGEHGEFPGG